MKARIKRSFRLLKALSTDPRIPRPVRWLIGASLAVKAVPFPDFGVDEIGLLIAFILLSTVYRKQFNEIREEIRQQEENGNPDDTTDEPTQDRTDPDRTLGNHDQADKSVDSSMTTLSVSPGQPESAPAPSA